MLLEVRTPLVVVSVWNLSLCFQETFDSHPMEAIKTCSVVTWDGSWPVFRRYWMLYAFCLARSLHGLGFRNDVMHTGACVPRLQSGGA